MDKAEIEKRLQRMRPKDYKIPHIEAKPLPTEPKNMHGFLKTFSSLEDYTAFTAMSIPVQARLDDALLNRAKHNAEFFLADLALDINKLQELIKLRPDILIQPVDEIRGIAKIFIELFYIEHEDLTLLANTNPAFLQFTKTELLNKIIKLCDIMQVSRYTIFDLVHKYPRILLFEVSALSSFITIVAKTFKCHQNSLRNAIFNYPQILELETSYIIDTYNKLYAKGFTRIELRQIFIDNAYNFQETAESIISKIDEIVKKENMSEKEARTMLGDCPFIIPLSYPADYFITEKTLKMSRKFLNEFQYNFLFPHQNFLIKYIFARCTAVEMQFSKIVNVPLHKLFSRYFFLREKFGTKKNFSADLSLLDFQFTEKYGIRNHELMERYPLTMEKIDTLFEDYNKLDGYILYWFKIDKPKEFVIPPVNFSTDILTYVTEHSDLPLKNRQTLAFHYLGFTLTEIQFFSRTINNFSKLTIERIIDIYKVFTLFEFNLEEINTMLLKNPAIFDYTYQALRNRLTIISHHFHPRFYCTLWPHFI